MAFTDFSPSAAVPLAPLTTLRVGGTAEWFCAARTGEELAAALRWAGDRGVVPFVLGGGSNVVVADQGLDGLVIRAQLDGYEETRSEDELRIRAGAGVSWDDVVARAVGAGFGGLECLSGIPGSVGGTPVQNVGAYGQEVGDVIERVAAIDVRTRERMELTRHDCGFSYRQSRFKGADAGRFVITSVEFRLGTRRPTLTYPDVVARLERAGVVEPSVADVRRAVLAVRRDKGMVLDPRDIDTRSVGSFFMNPVVDADVHAALAKHAGTDRVPGFKVGERATKVPAAWLIERCGFRKGDSAGAVGLSSKHPLAIVNRGDATASAVIDFAVSIKRRVADTFGIFLQIEPVCVGFSSDERMIFLKQNTPPCPPC